MVLENNKTLVSISFIFQAFVFFCFHSYFIDKLRIIARHYL